MVDVAVSHVLHTAHGASKISATRIGLGTVSRPIEALWQSNRRLVGGDWGGGGELWLSPGYISPSCGAVGVSGCSGRRWFACRQARGQGWPGTGQRPGCLGIVFTRWWAVHRQSIVPGRAGVAVSCGDRHADVADHSARRSAEIHSKDETRVRGLDHWVAVTNLGV